MKNIVEVVVTRWKRLPIPAFIVAAGGAMFVTGTIFRLANIMPWRYGGILSTVTIMALGVVLIAVGVRLHDFRIEDETHHAKEKNKCSY